MIFLPEDFVNTLLPFHYPVSEPTLAHDSWMEYWTKKQNGNDQSELVSSLLIYSQYLNLLKQYKFGNF
jgi:hypothetical protein